MDQRGRRPEGLLLLGAAHNFEGANEGRLLFLGTWRLKQRSKIPEYRLDMQSLAKRAPQHLGSFTCWIGMGTSRPCAQRESIHRNERM